MVSMIFIVHELLPDAHIAFVRTRLQSILFQIFQNEAFQISSGIQTLLNRK